MSTIVTPELVEGLLNAFLKGHFDNPADVPQFHREMWGLCCGPSKFVAIAAPRSFAKSTAITFAYTLACILFRERKFVLIIADTEPQAVLFLDEIQKAVTTNEDLIKTFGIRGLAKNGATHIEIEFDDGQIACLMAKGSGQRVRGLKWRALRPDLIVCDDLENEELVLNKEVRDKFQHWFTGALVPCRSKNGIIRMVGTILHTHSQLNQLMPRLGNKRKPCYTDDLREFSHPTAIWQSARYRAHDQRMTKSLWPEYKSLEFLKKERQVFIDAGKTDLWAQEMLNIPFDEANAPFKRRDFHGMEENEFDQSLNYYISADFATTDKQRSDYTVFMVAGVNSKGMLYILDVIRERLESPDILITLWDLLKKYDPQMVFVEKGQIWNMLSPLITNEMYKTGDFYTFEELPSSVDKRSRTGAIKARMRVGAVKFDKEADWWMDLEEECLRFTGGGSTHDDQVDALSLMGLALQKFVEAPTPEEELEEQYQEEMSNSGFFEQGRNEYTGY